jgi:tRNA(Ser,Leu) C12 N-acetylase TAN1
MMMHERADMMIGVKGSELKAVITTDIDLEHEACEDVENILFYVTPNASCMPLEREGLALVYADKGVDSTSLAKILAKNHIRGYWVYPVHKSCKASYEDIARCVFELLLLSNMSKPVRVLGKCRKRRLSIDSCTRLLRYIMAPIESLNIATVDFERPEYILRIEIVHDIAAISLYQASEERLFKVQRI